MSRSEPKNVFFFSVLVLVALVTAPALASDSAAFSVAERQELIDLLEDSRDQLMEAISDLEEEGWSYKAADDRWSVGEVVEHLLLTERQLFAAMQKAIAKPANANWATETAGKTELLRKVMPDRSQKAQAVSQIRPRGTLARAELIEQFQAARDQTLAFVRDTDLALEQYTEPHEFEFFGVLNAYQWLIYIPLHNQRHNAQVIEVLGEAGFPGRDAS